jgi:Arc/MetJ-type ribon-helix-helix transcriptional regulator
MTITLTPEQQRWLEQEVAAGRFPSVEAAVRIAVELLMPGHLTDLSWTRPYLDEARAAEARGESIAMDEARRRLAKRIESLRRT